MKQRANSLMQSPETPERVAVSFDEIGVAIPGVAYVHPVNMLSSALQEYLCVVASELGERIGFSRETPGRVRSVHHHVPQVVAELEESGMIHTLSAWAGEKLALHPSAHFGCSFNWTRLCVHGDADPWHLDAAPYTAIVLLSEPGKQFTGGDLCLYLGDAANLWQAIRRSERLPETSVCHVPFQQAGETLLFQGKHLAHRVGPVNAGTQKGLVGTNEGRLTLAIGLYAVDSPQRWLYPGSTPDDRLVRDSWRIESKKARLLAAIERIRRTASWKGDPQAETLVEKEIDEALIRLECL
jgi:hypothetical protein